MNSSGYMTSPTGNIFALHGLPTEVIAVLFARYSRSNRRLAEELDDMLAEEEATGGGTSPREFQHATDKAAKFHEKYVVGYGHGCYDGATEVLTVDGWVPWPAFVSNWATGSRPRLATLNPETGLVEYLVPDDVVVAPYRGLMYRVDTDTVDLLVTPNHKMWVANMRTRAGRQKTKYELVAASDLEGAPVAYQLSARWDGEHHDRLDVGGYPHTAADTMRLLGFFIGDGHRDERYADAVTFHLRRPRKIEFLRRVCAAMEVELREHANDKFYVKSPGLARWLGNAYDAETGDKIIPAGILSYSEPLLRALWEGLMQSDGHTDDGGHCLYGTTSTALRDQLYELALKLGMAAYASTDPREDRDNSMPMHVVHFNRTRLYPEVNKVSYRRQDRWEQYDGTVYCASMPRNHILYVRRNMRPVWCGNSVAEHAHIHYGIERCSILAAKAIEERRLGAAYTEKSTRYVMFDRDALVLEVGLPEELAPVYHAGAFALLDAYTSLCKRVGAEIARRRPDASTLAVRTKTFDLLRGLLPAGVQTSLGVTVNARAAAHMIRSLREGRLPECAVIADGLEAEGRVVAPTLVRHIEASRHRSRARVRVQDALRAAAPDAAAWLAQEEAREVAATVKRCPQVAALKSVAGADVRDVALNVLAEVGLYRSPVTPGLSIDEARAIVGAYLAERGRHDHVGRALERSTFRWVVVGDYGSWRDLQRHRLVSATTPTLTVNHGWWRSDELNDLGFGEEFDRAVEAVVPAYRRLAAFDADLAQYVVPLAFRVRYDVTMNLREAFHMIELRSTSAGHPSYRQIARSMARDVLAEANWVGDDLRVDWSEYEFAREPSKK